MSLNILPAFQSKQAQAILDLDAEIQEMRIKNGQRPARVRSVYKSLPPSARLSYPILSRENYREVPDLFEMDTNRFTTPYLLNREDWEEYVASELTLGRRSGKDGFCDWLLVDGQQLVGILSLYDISYELIYGTRSPASIGYMIAEPFRRKGYAEEAVRHLISLLPTQFQLFEARAEPHLENQASRSLLEKVGFERIKFSKNQWGPSAIYHRQLVKDIPKLSVKDIDW